MSDASGMSSAHSSVESLDSLPLDPPASIASNESYQKAPAANPLFERIDQLAWFLTAAVTTGALPMTDGLPDMAREAKRLEQLRAYGDRKLKAILEDATTVEERRRKAAIGDLSVQTCMQITSLSPMQMPNGEQFGSRTDKSSTGRPSQFLMHECSNAQTDIGWG